MCAGVFACECVCVHVRERMLAYCKCHGLLSVMFTSALRALNVRLGALEMFIST